MQQLTLALAPAPEPTFDTFFAGRNEATLATLAALRHALDGNEHFVYLWGPRGSGKSHLLRAFAADAARNGTPATYIAAGESMSAEASVVAADDAHQLDMVGQLALFDLYNRFRTSGGMLLSAGDRPPAELPLREDLRTRLGAGEVLRVEPLSDEEKRAALSEHGRQRGLALAARVVGRGIFNQRLEFVVSHASGPPCASPPKSKPGQNFGRVLFPHGVAPVSDRRRA